jgi:hypothetical protein
LITNIRKCKRGAFISGTMIILLPLMLGANSVWYAMLITEMVVAIFSLYYMVRYTRQLN